MPRFSPFRLSSPALAALFALSCGPARSPEAPPKERSAGKEMVITEPVAVNGT